MLRKLRKRDSLVERTPGSFYLKSKAFLHFHSATEFAKTASLHICRCDLNPIRRPVERLSCGQVLLLRHAKRHWGAHPARDAGNVRNGNDRQPNARHPAGREGLANAGRIAAGPGVYQRDRGETFSNKDEALYHVGAKAERSFAFPRTTQHNTHFILLIKSTTKAAQYSPATSSSFGE